LRFASLLLSLVVGCTPARANLVPDGPPALAPRVLRLTGPIMPSPEIGALVEDLETAVNARVPEVTVEIDSPGGSVGIGFALIDLFREARRTGVVVHCRVVPDGMAASMAAVFLESPACSTRAMAPTSALMFHGVSVGDVGGKEDDLRRLADILADVNKRVAIVVAPRLGMTAAAYLAWITDRDRWVSADEALAMGGVDAVR
jgi:ATP-dependent protease ClpP protease subunit